jgi:hypothetical protein
MVILGMLYMPLEGESEKPFYRAKTFGQVAGGVVSRWRWRATSFIRLMDVFVSTKALDFF